MLSVLKRLLKRLRQVWPDTLIIVRGDSHFAYPEVMQWIEAQANLSYVTGLTSNSVLKKLAHEVVEQAKRAYARDGGKVTRFHSTRYQAGTWWHPRRVVIKVEVSEQGVNTRFVVTDLEQARTKVIYRQLYCARGQAENEIKDHKRYLKSDRTSCHRFEANQFRLFLHSAASVLLDTLRREVFQGTSWARATMETIQLRLLKPGARVQEFTERIKISLPSSCPVAPVLRRSLTLLACVRLNLLYAPLLPPIASRNLLLIQSLPTNFPFWQAIPRRRKDDHRVGTAARGIIERLYRFPRRVQSDDGSSGRFRGALSTRS